MAPVVKRGRKPGSGRGGRGKGRGGARGGRSQNSAPSTAPVAVAWKRERSPSLDSSKAPVRGKVAKLTPVPQNKSQESPRSLRSRGGQNQSYSSPADEVPNTQQRTYKRKAEAEDVEMGQSSFGTPTGESWKTRSSVPPVSVAVQKAQESGSTGESTDSSGKRIPRLIDVSAANRREALSGVTPLEWTPQDVAQFLRVNDCTAYCDTFTKAVSTVSTMHRC